MADHGKHWLKLWTSILTDSKAANLGQADFGKWIRLMLAVKLEGIDGTLEIEHPGLYLLNLLADRDNPIEDTFEGLIEYISLLPGIKVKKSTTEVGVISAEITFKNWEYYQGYVDTTNAERQRRYKASNRKVTEKVTDEVTPKVTISPSVSVSSSLISDSNKKESNINNWEPKQKHRDKAESRGVSFADALETFQNYCINNPRKYKDKDAAFMNWILSPLQKSNGSKPRFDPAFDKPAVNEFEQEQDRAYRKLLEKEGNKQ